MTVTNHKVEQASTRPEETVRGLSLFFLERWELERELPSATKDLRQPRQGGAGTEPQALNSGLPCGWQDPII